MYLKQAAREPAMVEAGDLDVSSAMLSALEPLILLLWRREMIHGNLSVTERRLECKHPVKCTS